MDDQEKLARARAIATGVGRSQEHLRVALDHLDRMTARVEVVQSDLDFVLGHNGARQIAELEQRNTTLQTENEKLRNIAEMATEWGRAIHNLEQARKKPEDGEQKKGGESVYKANQAYTKAHLALKAALKPAISES